jgi:molybdopterin biosynthesis enzyme MoaB
MRQASLKITRWRRFPRGGGYPRKSLIVNLPGSPRAARENLEAVIGALSHGIDMLLGGDIQIHPVEHWRIRRIECWTSKGAPSNI